MSAPSLPPFPPLPPLPPVQAPAPSPVWFLLGLTVKEALLNVLPVVVTVLTCLGTYYQAKTAALEAAAAHQHAQDNGDMLTRYLQGRPPDLSGHTGAVQLPAAPPTTSPRTIVRPQPGDQ